MARGAHFAHVHTCASSSGGYPGGVRTLRTKANKWPVLRQVACLRFSSQQESPSHLPALPNKRCHCAGCSSRKRPRERNGTSRNKRLLTTDGSGGQPFTTSARFLEGLRKWSPCCTRVPRMVLRVRTFHAKMNGLAKQPKMVRLELTNVPVPTSNASPRGSLETQLSPVVTSVLFS